MTKDAHKRKDVSPTTSFVAGSLAGLVEILATQPLDTGHKRVQAFANPIFDRAKSFVQNANALNAVIFRDQATATWGQKWMELYKGLRAAAPYKVAQRGIKSYSQKKVEHFLQHNHRFQALVRRSFDSDKAVANAAAAFGGSASGLAELILTPLDIWKIKLQTQTAMPGQKYTLKQIFTEGNPFKALPLTATRNVFGSFVLFLISKALETEQKQSTLRTIANSTAASTACIVSIYPLDLIKTRKQAAPNNPSFSKVFFDILANEGPFALWKGVQMKVYSQAPKLILWLTLLKEFEIFLTNNLEPVVVSTKKEANKYLEEKRNSIFSNALFTKSITANQTESETPAPRPDTNYPRKP